MHQSGFVSIIGRPNVGKSTLMNAIVGERMSIITSKPQTTRHRILGIVSDENYQIVFSDTPGIIQDPSYKMHASMNRFVNTTFEDSDIMIFITDIYDKYEDDDPVITRLNQVGVPVILVINKIDIADKERLQETKDLWESRVVFNATFLISALEKINTEELIQHIIKSLPEGPVYYPKDQLTDRPERFFVSEIIREKILLNYRQEIPYSCEVVVESFKEDPDRPLIRIAAFIYVSRNTQKSIIIGKNGAAIKKLGIEARKDLEVFLEKQIYLELRVKVRDNWRDDDRMLKYFGY